MRLGIETGLNAVAVAVVDDDGAVVAVGSSSGPDALAVTLAALKREICESITSAVIAMNPEVPAGQLERTAVLRLSGPSHAALTPLANWPKDLAVQIGPLIETIHGGATLGGRGISQTEPNQIIRFAQQAAQEGVSGIAVCAAGSATRTDLEEACAETIRSVAPGLSITLSHTLGGIGLRDRENATVLNMALRRWAARFSDSAAETLAAHRIDASIYFARTSGGSVRLERFRQYPIVCLDGASGCLPLGATQLAGIFDGVVVDAGLNGIRSVVMEAGILPVRPESLYESAVRTSVAEVAYEQMTWNEAAAEDVYGTISGKTNLTATLALGGFNGHVIVVGPRAEELVPEFIPHNARFAAAVGAAMSPVRADLERVVRIDGSGSLADALTSARDDTINQAVESGAARTTIAVERLEHTPMSYLPPGFHSIVASASGRPQPSAPRP